MSTWTVTNRMTGEVAYAYGADAPDHLAIYPFDTYNHTRAPEIVEAPKRRLTKLELIGRMGEAVFVAIIGMAQQSTEMAAWVEMVRMTTPDPDGTSIDLDDPRTVAGLNAIEPALIAQGVVSAGWAAGVVA